MNRFDGYGTELNGVLSLSSGEAFELCKKEVILIDIRKSYETDYKKFDLPEVLLLPKNEFHINYNSLDKNKTYIVADSSGLSSKKAVLFLLENGFKSVANLSGGILDWERNGFPVTTDKKEALAKPYFYDSKPKNFVKTTLIK